LAGVGGKQDSRDLAGGGKACGGMMLGINPSMM
jgi:hypothetical protein